MSNLVEIESQDYLDVVRFILLFEFYHGGYERKRVVVDFVKHTYEVIVVDESEVKKGANYLDLH